MDLRNAEAVIMQLRSLLLTIAVICSACAPTSLVQSTATATSTPIPTPAPTATVSATVQPSPNTERMSAETLTSTPFPSTNTPTPRRVQLAAVGDVMLARTIGERILRQGPDIPFAGVKSVLDRADVLVANLECTISDRGSPESKGYTFRAPLAAAAALELAGVDVVSQANNHAFDLGREAFAQTSQILAQRGIGVFGAGENETVARKPFILERNGLRIAFLGYVDVPIESRGFDTRRWTATASAPGIAWAETAHIQRDVAAATRVADVVVVMFHFGFEGRTTPSSAQRAEAHAAIDAGAALVLGAHPHVLQGTEKYRGRLIAYSLGNFVFDGFSGIANESAILTATITRDGVQDHAWTPVIVENGMPRLAKPSESARILARLKSLD